MNVLRPSSPGELATALHDASNACQTICVAGNNSKRSMAGPVTAADIHISTASLNQVLQYERNDLTVSVEAGLPFAKLQELLRNNGQMIAVNPSFFEEATIGGVLASNSSGPLRRGYGTVRDLVIGMTFATLEGKLIKVGGMVVKNVAGLDMGKLLIGSFGTLAVITSVNFRIHSLPEETMTFLFFSPVLKDLIEKRTQILQSVLQPISLDLLSNSVTNVGENGWLLAIRAGGTRTVLNRYMHELSGAQRLTQEEEDDFWKRTREFTPSFLNTHSEGVVLRIGTSFSDISTLLGMLSFPCISRSASGVTYIYLNSWQETLPIWHAAQVNRWSAVVEFAPDHIRRTKELWLQSPSPYTSNGFVMMEKVKQMFDPQKLLNRSRLYGRI